MHKYDSLSLSEDFEHYAVADNMEIEVSTWKAFHNKIKEISESKYRVHFFKIPLLEQLLRYKVQKKYFTFIQIFSTYKYRWTVNIRAGDANCHFQSGHYR